MTDAEHLFRAIDTALTVREGQVVRMRWGLDGGGERTLEEVGRMLGITRSRVHQIEKRALTKLKGAETAQAERLLALGAGGIC